MFSSWKLEWVNSDKNLFRLVHFDKSSRIYLWTVSESNSDKETELNEYKWSAKGRRKKCWQISIFFESVWLNLNVEQVRLDNFVSLSDENT